MLGFDEVHKGACTLPVGEAHTVAGTRGAPCRSPIATRISFPPQCLHLRTVYSRSVSSPRHLAICQSGRDMLPHNIRALAPDQSYRGINIMSAFAVYGKCCLDRAALRRAVP